ncbi:hypothetical protein GCM10010299_43520 [Streptomyces tanashiensis]|nr:hypothetical protein GCM10010299_43520 [Streptomyces tanashiensis]
MGGWIGVGLGAAAALCPLPHHADVAVVMDHSPTHGHLVVCAPDVWVDMGYGDGPTEAPRPTCASTSPPTTLPPTAPPPPSPTAPPLPPRPSPPPPPPSVPEPVPPRPPALSPPQAAPAPPAPPAPDPQWAPPAPPAPAITTPTPAQAPKGFRWEPRSHYTGGPSRPAPAKLSMTMSTVVITLPAVLAAAALRPGSRRRGRG